VARELKEGMKAPDFSLPSDQGQKVKLSAFKGVSNVVLFFYPKDNTPGCTQEACDFRDSIKKVKRKDTEVFGISLDSLASHEKFAGKFKLNFPLLSDAKKTVAEKYQVYKEKSLYGRKFMGIERSTFVIDKEGKIQKAFRKVKVTGHVAAVLDALGNIES